MSVFRSSLGRLWKGQHQRGHLRGLLEQEVEGRRRQEEEGEVENNLPDFEFPVLPETKGWKRPNLKWNIPDKFRSTGVACKLQNASSGWQFSRLYKSLAKTDPYCEPTVKLIEQFTHMTFSILHSAQKPILGLKLGPTKSLLNSTLAFKIRL